MSLFVATLLFGILALAKGILFLVGREKLREPILRGLRNDRLAYAIFGLGAAWFLFEVWQMGDAEAVFGNLTRPILLVGGLVVAFGSFSAARDFLVARGAAVLALLAATRFLDAAFLQDPTSRLVMVTGVYVMIVIALYVGTIPYKARDFYEWLFAKSWRPIALGILLSTYGLATVGTAFTY